MKKPNHYQKNDDAEDKGRVHISQRVMARFREELAKVNGSFEKLLFVYRAKKMSGEEEVVCAYDDPGKYQKYLETNGLADLDLMFDFYTPINYFRILKERI